MTGTCYSGSGWVKRVCTRATGRATTGAGSRSCGSMLTGSSRRSSGRGETIMWRCANPSLSHLGEGMFLITFVLSFPFSLTNSCIILRDGQYGLYLDESLLDCSSAPRTTFGRSIMFIWAKEIMTTDTWYRPVAVCHGYCTSSSYECSIYLNT
jgi:hypothetical protein